MNKPNAQWAVIAAAIVAIVALVAVLAAPVLVL
jgi:hypothetical protein